MPHFWSWVSYFYGNARRAGWGRFEATWYGITNGVTFAWRCRFGAK